MKKSSRQAGARQKRGRKTGFAGVAIGVEADSTAAANYWQDEAHLEEAPVTGLPKLTPVASHNRGYLSYWSNPAKGNGKWQRRKAPAAMMRLKNPPLGCCSDFYTFK